MAKQVAAKNSYCKKQSDATDLGRSVVNATGREPVGVVCQDALAVEHRQETDKQAAIPVVRDTPTIVALQCQNNTIEHLQLPVH